MEMPPRRPSRLVAWICGLLSIAAASYPVAGQPLRGFNLKNIFDTARNLGALQAYAARGIRADLYPVYASAAPAEWKAAWTETPLPLDPAGLIPPYDMTARDYLSSLGQVVWEHAAGCAETPGEVAFALWEAGSGLEWINANATRDCIDCLADAWRRLEPRLEAVGRYFPSVTEVAIVAQEMADSPPTSADEIPGYDAASASLVQTTLTIINEAIGSDVGFVGCRDGVLVDVPDPADLDLMPDVEGRLVDEARKELQRAGFSVRLEGLGAPRSADMALRVAAQLPAAGSPRPADAVVTLRIYGPYSAALVLPDLVGRPVGDALEWLEDAGLRATVTEAGEAPDPQAAQTVRAHTPRSQVSVEPGSTVALSVYGDYVARTSSLVIVGTDYPPAIQAGDPAADLSVRWRGDPVPPVDLVFRPRSCPPGFDCRERTVRYESLAPSVTAAGLVGCTLSGRDDWQMDYEVLLRAADGFESAPVAVPIDCRAAPEPAPPPRPVPPPEPDDRDRISCPEEIPAGVTPDFETGPGSIVQYVWNERAGYYCGYLRDGGRLTRYRLRPRDDGYDLLSSVHDFRAVMRMVSDPDHPPDPASGWTDSGWVFAIEQDGSLSRIGWWFRRPPTRRSP